MQGFNDQDILITGGAGFIGTRLRRAFKDARRVVLVDNFLPQVHRTPRLSDPLSANESLFRMDVADPNTWEEVLADFRPTLVVHLAAETGTGQSLTESARHSYTNVHGTAVMIDALLRHHALPEQILLCSSKAVYGEGDWADPSGMRFTALPRDAAALQRAQWDPVGPSGRQGKPLAHHSGFVSPRPTNIYAATKLAQENVLNAWCQSFQVPLTILRLQNAYGSGQSISNGYAGVLTFFARQMLAGSTAEVFEEGGIVRDFVHISDAVQAIVSALLKPPSAEHPRTLDIGSGAHDTLLAYAMQLAEATGAEVPVVSRRYRLGDVRSAFADINPARREIGYEPSVPFSRGLEDVVSWVQQGLDPRPSVQV